MNIAITGGIGSGKSFVCRLLEERGIRVYDCDAAAKRLMRTSSKIQSELRNLVGDEVCKDGVIQKKVLSAFLLESEDHKLAVNEIVHPAVASDCIHSGYSWIESAILFDSHFYERVHFGFIVGVTASIEVRTVRIIKRDSISREKAMEWIMSQLPQDKVAARCDFVINNDGKTPLKPQIEKLLYTVREKS